IALLAFLALGGGRGAPAIAARVKAAVQRATTWHLKGWRDNRGKRIPWEIWGRRRPFFFREESGEKVVVDDGRERLENFPGAGGGGMLFVRMASRPLPGDEMWVHLTTGERWPENRP